MPSGLLQSLLNRAMGPDNVPDTTELSRNVGAENNYDLAPPETPDPDLARPVENAKMVNIKDPIGRLTGSYNPDRLKEIVLDAKHRGIDPYTALAIAGQESTFGKADPTNPMRVLRPYAPIPEPDNFGASIATG